METSVVRKSGKKEKTPLQEFEAQVKDIRQQFVEQVKCLESRTDSQAALLLEVQDFYKRRADVELDYSRNLEKLAKQVAARHKAEKQKREGWAVFSLHGHWQQMVEQTKSEARNRASTADLYVNHVSPKLAGEVEELQRISKRCREIACAAQQEILRVLGELHTAMKTYQLCHAASCAAETKFRAVDAQKCRFEETNPKKIGARKHRFLEKEYEKKHAKHMEFKLKALKARNEYLLCIDAANAALHKYFADDLSDLLDCMDVGSEQWLKNLVATVADARRAVLECESKQLDADLDWIRDMDNRADKRKFMEANHSTFMLPRKFEFRSHGVDDVCRVSAAKTVQEDLVQRYWQLNQRLTQLKTETEEVWKTLETAEKTLMDIQKMPEVKLTELYAAGAAETPRRSSCRESDTAQQKRKQDLLEMEDYYLQKFHFYLLTGNLIRRLEARHDAIQIALGMPPAAAPTNGHEANGAAVSISMSRESSLQAFPGGDPAPSPDAVVGGGRMMFGMAKPKKKRIGGSAAVEQRPKLFGGSIEEYVEATGHEVPLIIRSCVRMLSLHGLHHQGVFRVSGSQIEINAFKEAFEKGEDPLTDVADASDVNSVSGVLKLYFRELREPLFPIFMFDQFVECSRIDNKDDFPSKVRDLVKTLPRSVFVVMRYLFAFLNHLSEFSDENMMDPYNLAICFGPTLLPIPESRDQVFYHNHVNDLIKNMIMYHDDIFPNDGGLVYEKYLFADNVNEDDEDGGVAGADEDDAMLTSVSETPLILYNDENAMSRSVLNSGGRRSRNYNRSTSCGSQSDLDLSAHVSLKAPDSPGNMLDALDDLLEQAIGTDDDETVWRKHEKSAPPNLRPNSDDKQQQQHNVARTEIALARMKFLSKEGENVDAAHLDSASSVSSASNSPVEVKMAASATSPLNVDTTTHFFSVKNHASSLASSTSSADSKSPRPTNHQTAQLDSWSLKQYGGGGRREGAIASLKRLSLNSYGPPATSMGGGGKLDEPQSAESDSELTRPASARFSQQQAAPKGLSPTSLKEIQVELKAVLNSLESFTLQQTRLSAEPPAAAPDLVQNLPSFEDLLAGRVTSSSSSVAPTDPPSSAAEQFAENKESTLKKNSSASGSDVSDESAAARCKQPKPPIPRKPSGNSPLALRRATGNVIVESSAKF